MEKGDKSDLFVNDGSFFEKFNKLQQQKAVTSETKSSSSSSSNVAPKSSVVIGKRPLDLKGSDVKKPSVSVSGAKLAFSLKQKSKVPVAPVKFVADEDDEREAVDVYGDETAKRQRVLQLDAKESSLSQDFAPFPPNDPSVRKVADKLASFVAKNGRQFEHITRQRNPGDTPFKFLFDSNCSDYKYYEYQLRQEEKALAVLKEPQAPTTSITATSTAIASNNHRNTLQQQPDYQTPAAALYGAYEEPDSAGGRGGPSAADPVAMMEFYMKKAAQEERRRQPKLSKDEMPPPPSLQGPIIKKGHHMGDFIPEEELEKFLASCNDAAAQKAAKEAAERARIQADNIGHKLLSKMGWKEGEGLGSDRSGRADPVMAGSVKKDHLGVGASNPGEVTAEDDIYEQYKKRMMLGYRHRPNPMNNPRKAYY